MSWKTKFEGLYKRVLKALNAPSESALDKQVTRAAIGLTTEEALFIIANKYGVKSSRDFSRLTPDSQLRVNSAIRSAGFASLAVSTGSKVPPKAKLIKTLSISTPFGALLDPFLPAHIVSEAIEMADTAYPYLYFLENSVRNFISVILTKKYGSDWWKRISGTKALDDISKKASDRMKKEEKLSYHGKRGAHPIYYVDFLDLITLTRSLQRDFNAFFDNLPGKLNGFLNKFDELAPSRNVTAHHNPLSVRDRNRLVGYLHDWLGQLKYLDDNHLL